MRGCPSPRARRSSRDRIAETDSIMVSRLRAAGACSSARRTFPSSGSARTAFNPVFGVTGNAYDPTKTGGGSSGGAAVAVALRMQPVSDGTDHGGSLRNRRPSTTCSACALLGAYSVRNARRLQPKPQRPRGHRAQPGRYRPDALGPGGIRSALPEFDPTGPCRPASQGRGADFRGVRIAWLGDFGGQIPFEPGVLETCRAALTAFADIGCLVDEASPDFDLEQVWQDWGRCAPSPSPPTCARSWRTRRGVR